MDRPFSCDLSSNPHAQKKTGRGFYYRHIFTRRKRQQQWNLEAGKLGSRWQVVTNSTHLKIWILRQQWKSQEAARFMLHNSQELAGPGISGGKGLHRATHKMMNWKPKKETVSQPGLLPAQQSVGSTQVISTHFAGGFTVVPRIHIKVYFKKVQGNCMLQKKKNHAWISNIFVAKQLFCKIFMYLREE